MANCCLVFVSRDKLQPECTVQRSYQLFIKKCKKKTAVYALANGDIQ